MEENENLNVVFLTSPVGILKIEGTPQGITCLTFCNRMGREDPANVLLDCRQQLHEYFYKDRKQFTIPLMPSGTDFQKKVWKRVLDIPLGQTLSYSELAIDLGDIKKVRAVGLANSKNPIPILIPCHRVVGKDGELTGYAGGLNRKKWLLDHERGWVQLSLFS